MLKIGIVIQARINSSRLPAKVLAKIEGKPLIWHIINRIKRVRTIDTIILATSPDKRNTSLLKIAEELKVDCFVGDELDVLDRFYQCASSRQLDIIIRITGDCPLVDSKLIEEMISFFKKHRYDYVSNALCPTYPDGLDVEIFSIKTLKKAWKNAKKLSEREHVTPYIINNSKKFKIFNYSNKINLSHLRWTVDQKEDLKFVRRIYQIMAPKKIFSTTSILKLLKNYPDIQRINAHIERNEGYFKSLMKDKPL